MIISSRFATSGLLSSQSLYLLTPAPRTTAPRTQARLASTPCSQCGKHGTILHPRSAAPLLLPPTSPPSSSSKHIIHHRTSAPQTPPGTQIRSTFMALQHRQRSLAFSQPTSLLSSFSPSESSLTRHGPLAALFSIIPVLPLEVLSLPLTETHTHSKR